MFGNEAGTVVAQHSDVPNRSLYNDSFVRHVLYLNKGKKSPTDTKRVVLGVCVNRAGSVLSS